jgi:phosphate-selective porin OprO/OprP
MKHFVLGSCLCALMAGSAHAKEGFRADENGLIFESGDFQLNVGGRLHVDAAAFDDPASSSNRRTDVAFRRARLEVSGRLWKIIRFRVDREFAGGSKGWRNAWLSVEPVKDVVIRGGNFIVPFSGEDLQSSNSLPFAERSLMSALTPGFGLGGSVSTNGKMWSASLGYFTDPLDGEENRSTERGKGVVGRVTLAPVRGNGNVVHLAFAGERRTFTAGERMRFSADPGSNLAPNLMSSGTLHHLDTLSSWTAEAGAAFGPFLVQGQAVATNINRNAAANLHFNGQNLQATWLLTGGRYDYSVAQGAFDGPDLRQKKGAVELAARVSRLDLNDATVAHGVGTALTGGVNWYLNRNLRIMADYTRSRVHFPATGKTIHDNVAVARFQVAF